MSMPEAATSGKYGSRSAGRSRIETPTTSVSSLYTLMASIVFVRSAPGMFVTGRARLSIRWYQISGPIVTCGPAPAPPPRALLGLRSRAPWPPGAWIGRRLLARERCPALAAPRGGARQPARHALVGPAGGARVPRPVPGDRRGPRAASRVGREGGVAHARDRRGRRRGGGGRRVLRHMLRLLAVTALRHLAVTLVHPPGPVHARNGAASSRKPEHPARREATLGPPRVALAIDRQAAAARARARSR